MVTFCAGIGAHAAAVTPAPTPVGRDASPLKAEPRVGAQEREPAVAEKVVAPKTSLLLGTAVSGAKLGGERGKADIVNSEARLSGVVSGNSATNMTTGANSIDSGSFANMAGLPVVIQNTGANVLIQNSTIVNVQFK